MNDLRIDGKRLWNSLMELAQIGATPKGGVRRLTLTDEDRRARDLFCRWARDAGLAVEVDGIGNLFARRAGTDPSLPPVAMGSHLDSQPSGGKFDGAYGVMAGLEVLRTLNDAGIRTRAPTVMRCPWPSAAISIRSLPAGSSTAPTASWPGWRSRAR